MNDKTTMKMNIKVFLTVFVMLLCISPSYGQTNDLSKEDMEELLKQTQLKVNQFNDYISFIAKKERYRSYTQQQQVEQTKKEYIKQALKLFIGKGEAYTDEYGNQQPAPVMEVSRLLRNGKFTVSRRKIGNYLNALKNLNYSSVRVSAGSAFFTSEAKQVGENKYMVTLSYRQYFIGERDGKVVYRDRTDKTVTVYIEKQVNGGHVRWTVLLGDIKVEATSKN